ncbi:MAG: hypothetical protein R8J84_03675 [Mariprofundales bacterium]
MKPKRPNILARWLRRCPTCGAWFALKRTVTEQGITGEKSDYRCTKCNAEVHDWNPDARVKF